MEPMGLVTWCTMKLLLWAGAPSLFAVLAVLGWVIFYVGYVVGGLARKDRPMSHAKLDHIKYDILPDGSLGPGDNRNLEGPE